VRPIGDPLALWHAGERRVIDARIGATDEYVRVPGAIRAECHMISLRSPHRKNIGGGVGRQTNAGRAGEIRDPNIQVFLLDRNPRYLWGIVSNGLRLRLLRDNISLTRQAYIEFDLEAMMAGEAYPEFVVLWLLLHQSRFEGEQPELCQLEKWSQAAQTEGVRVLDGLRDGVQKAIEQLGQGFLAHPSNAALREKLRSGVLDKQDYYRQLLRLVYRLLFLFVAEDGDLLLIPEAEPDAQKRYCEHYATTRLRRLAMTRAGSRHHDLYCGLRLVMGQALGRRLSGVGVAGAWQLPVLSARAGGSEHLRDSELAIAGGNPFIGRDVYEPEPPRG
jgi:hypothetical protein